MCCMVLYCSYLYFLFMLQDWQYNNTLLAGSKCFNMQHESMLGGGGRGRHDDLGPNKLHTCN